jgi:hypothetical protein
LFLDEGEKAAEFMIPTPRIPTIGTNWRGLTWQISLMKDLGSGERTSDELEGKRLRRTRRNSMIIETKRGLQAWSQSVPGRPLLAPIYRWPGPEEPVGWIQISLIQDVLQHNFIFRLWLCFDIYLGL